MWYYLKLSRQTTAVYITPSYVFFDSPQIRYYLSDFAPAVLPYKVSAAYKGPQGQYLIIYINGIVHLVIGDNIYNGYLIKP